MLAGVLVLCCLGLLLLEALSRGRARYARVGSGSARSQTPRRLSLPLAALALLLPISLTALALGVPFITLARWCNQPSFLKKKSFRQFCEANGLTSSAFRYMSEFEHDHPDIAKQYFDIRFDRHGA